MIKTENLTRRFGSKVAVDSLTLDIARGEVFGFLGPNGAGKTTTVRMLVGLIGMTSGAAVVNGYDVHRDPMQVRRTTA
jgi:ABC-2 type transport system ATP-binding protein